MSGYLETPDKTAETIKDSWLRTVTWVMSMSVVVFSSGEEAGR
ncbi:hypothetical protein DT99_035195 [Burkholderia seminalis]|uniref:Uncharacterized protein n=1 Tax=Burkholderia seminalis TaxID=488731 RepID=A0A8A8DG09_9BURK|nr:hypothetical protein DT99_035195 [Burkholderia seminalis]